ncbi:hypothetical protein TVAG_416210 [Trichomonas vaginalis G3]|uniref:Uncharacterized protein n=1 Tax=Trichomonas vaginalis (strain ATCC PRA-98 / G3) TaxID=412133 RepID=A2FQ52_TRIV3|nr:hypothetical protein TVAGG3_0748380 [Trichomonas vaginalis G3]EAX92959.1 hypothetical protein TVAG_416210 [Trichomonas vaginalis G3]KAI5512348.1 hypothetical protein TVAGG3_0748380 [Trichomonas vaginalis G3]|eukprot:XP_001305889.1 hypothetical protein [Trichomonas vaginalis G3]
MQKSSPSRSSSRSSSKKSGSPSAENSSFSFIPSTATATATPINKNQNNQNYVPKSVTFTGRNRFIEGTEAVTSKNITPIVKSRKILVNSTEKSQKLPETSDSGLIIGSKFEYSPISEDTHSISNFTPKRLPESSAFAVSPISEPSKSSSIETESLIPKSKLVSDEEEEFEEEDNTETHINNSDSATFQDDNKDSLQSSDNVDEIEDLQETNKKLLENQKTLISIINDLTSTIVSSFGYNSKYDIPSILDNQNEINLFLDEIHTVQKEGIQKIKNSSSGNKGLSNDVMQYIQQVSNQIQAYQDNLEKQHNDLMNILK